MKTRIRWITLGLVALLLVGFSVQEPAAQNARPEDVPAVAEEPQVEVSQDMRVTLNAEDALVTQLLNAFSRQTGRSIVVGPEITGRTTVRLNHVPWNEALDAVLKPFGYVHYETGEATVVTTITPFGTRVYSVKHLDVADVEESIRSMLSPQGKITKITTRSQSWANATQSGSSSVAGGDTIGKRQRVQEEKEITKSKTLVVTDSQRVLDQISAFLAEVDRAPQQILIEARFLEVNPQVLRDIGLEFGTRGGYTQNGSTYGYGAEQVNATVSPGNFTPVSTPSLNSVAPFNAGLNLAFQKLSSVQYGLLLHALEEDSSANVLSAPRILTLNNQEASIIIGTKYPIINSEASDSGGGGSTITTSLRGYEDIGIQLNVLPQICDNDLINMIVRPSVRELLGNKSGVVEGGDGQTALTEYPIISTREAETQVVLKNGQTIVIGGLLKDRQSKVTIKVPFLGSIPVVGWLFRRETLQNEKIDLLIFLTATVVPPEGSVLTVTNVNSLASTPMTLSPATGNTAPTMMVSPGTAQVTPTTIPAITPTPPAAPAPGLNPAPRPAEPVSIPAPEEETPVPTREPSAAPTPLSQDTLHDQIPGGGTG